MPQLIFGQPRRATPFQAPFPRPQSRGNPAMELLAAMQQPQPGADTQMQISGQLALEALRQSFATRGRADELSLLRDQFEEQKRTSTRFEDLQGEILGLQLRQGEQQASRDEAAFKFDERRAEEIEKKEASDRRVTDVEEFGKLAKAGLGSDFSELQRKHNDMLTVLDSNYPSLFDDLDFFNAATSQRLSDIFVGGRIRDVRSNFNNYAATLTQALRRDSAESAAANLRAHEFLSKLNTRDLATPAVWNDDNVVALRRELDSRATKDKFDLYNKDISDFDQKANQLTIDTLLDVFKARSKGDEERNPALLAALEEFEAKYSREQTAPAQQQDVPAQQQSSNFDRLFATPPADDQARLLQDYLATLQQ